MTRAGSRAAPSAGGVAGAPAVPGTVDAPGGEVAAARPAGPAAARPVEQPAAPARPVPAARVVLAPWLVSRLLVGLALAGVALATARLPVAGDAPHPTGLFAWDGAWYRQLAAHGYHATQDWRFFPLLPLLGRAAGWLLGGHVDAGLLVVGNLAAFGYAVLIVRLVRAEVGDGPWLRRAAWLALLAPGACVLALPYTEAVAGLLAVGYFLALRTDRTLLAVAAGFAGGLARPTGLVLALPGLMVAFDGWVRWARWRPAPLRRTPWRRTAARLVAAAAPVAGTLAFCGWAWVRTGSAWLPYTAQTDNGLRGGVVRDPLVAPFTGGRLGLPWPATLAFVAVAIALLVLTFRLLPARYGVWSAAMLFLATSSSNDHSLPRYLSALFPLLVAAGLWAGSRRRWVPVMGAAGAGFCALAVMGFTSWYIP